MTEQTPTFAERLFDCFNTRDMDGIADMLADDARHSAPGSTFGVHVEGKDELMGYFKNNVFPMFAEIKFIPDNIYRNAAENVDIIEWHGHFYPASGKPRFDSKGVFVVAHNGEKITWIREYFDTEKTKNAMS